MRQESKWQVAGTEFRMLYTQVRGAECSLVHTEERNYKGSLKSQPVKSTNELLARGKDFQTLD